MNPSTQPAPKTNRRLQIVAAAKLLMQQRGLGSVTTRAIAEAVSCSEAAIYVHFANRSALLLEVFEGALPDMLVPLHALADAAGRGTPEGNLHEAMRGLQKFHAGVTPLLASLFSDVDLLQQFRQKLEGRGKGPQDGIGRLARYIREEQALGRVKAEVDADAAAATLMAASFFGAFTQALLGSTRSGVSVKRMVAAALQEKGK